MGSGNSTDIMKEYVYITGECKAILGEFFDFIKDFRKTEIYQRIKNKFDESFIKLKSDLAVYQLEIDTDIEIFDQIKRSIIKLEEIFQTNMEIKSKCLNKEDQIKIKRIIHDEIQERIEIYEKNLDNRNIYRRIDELCSNFEYPYRNHLVLGGAGIIMKAVGAFFYRYGYFIDGFIQIFLGGKYTTLIIGVIAALLSSFFFARYIIYLIDCEKDKFKEDYHEVWSKLKAIESGFKKLNEYLTRCKSNLINLKTFCNDIETCQNFNVIQKDCSDVKTNIVDCIASQKEIKAAINNLIKTIKII